jgi:hypothetical protein
MSEVERVADYQSSMSLQRVLGVNQRKMNRFMLDRRREVISFLIDQSS